MFWGVLFWSLFLSATAYILFKGDVLKRSAIGIMVFGVTATTVIYVSGSHKWLPLNVSILAIDSIALLAFIWISVRSRQLWPLLLVAWQLGGGDDPRGEQFCNRSAAESLWRRPGHLGVSSVRDNFHGYGEGSAQTRIAPLKGALGPDFSEAEVKLLIARFGSTARLHSAPTSAIAEILGDQIRAVKLKSILQIAADIAGPEQIEHPVIDNCVELIKYLQSVMGEQRVETFRVLFLDTHNKLISDEVLWRGTISEVPVYPREVMRRALQLDSSAFIAAHNHPSDVVIPSASDIDMTKQLLRASAALGIMFHDHFIVSARSYHSMRFHQSVLPWSTEQFE